MSHRALALVLFLALLTACERSPDLLPPDLRDGPPHPSPDFVDGSVDGGNPHFFFLPPIAEREPEFDRSFNPELRPAVDVCVLDGGRCADPQPDGFPFRYTMDGEGSEVVRLVEEDEHYILNWHARGLDPGQLYRLAVFPVADGTELGHVDLEPVRGRAQPREGFMPLHTGRTVPVKFRIETGILCEGENDCVEEVVGPAGGTVITPNGFAGADFPEGALEDDVVVAIDRITPTESDPCLPTDLEQAEGCYRFQTDPGPTTFAVPATAGVCLDPQVRDRPEHDQFQLHKFSPERPEDGVVALPNVAALFIDCEDFASLALDEDAGLLTRLVSSGFDLVDPLAHFLGPQQLGAADIGFGGELIEFSRIGWARPLAIEIVAGDGQEAEVGTTVPTDPTVRVTAAHFHGRGSSDAPPVQGVEVRFEVVAGDGGLGGGEVGDLSGTLTRLTDENGIASASWTLGAVGENVVAVHAPGGLDAQFVAEGRPSVLGGPSMALGVVHSCAITEAGETFCWGGNSTGQLGDGSTTASPVPTRVSGDRTFRVITADALHTCAVDTGDTPLCWGWNGQGQLGDGGTRDRTVPTVVGDDHRFVDITTGDNHSCGLGPSGEALCWGKGRNGQLGDGNIVDRRLPVAVRDGHDFVQITAGGSHTCAVDGLGDTHCWGRNIEGQLGNGATAIRETKPVAVAFSGQRFMKVDAGRWHTCGLLADGRALCWGLNREGQLGTGDTQGRSRPTSVSGSIVSGGLRFSTIALGDWHSCALDDSGAAYCWGQNSEGQLGNNTTAGSTTPVLVAGGHSFVAIAAGDFHTCAMDAAGAVFCWGDNRNGQLGIGSATIGSSVPLHVLPLR